MGKKPRELTDSEQNHYMVSIATNFATSSVWVFVEEAILKLSTSSSLESFQPPLHVRFTYLLCRKKPLVSVDRDTEPLGF